MIYSIRSEKRSENLKRTWANFGLSIAFCVLFLVSWAADSEDRMERKIDQIQQQLNQMSGKK